MLFDNFLESVYRWQWGCVEFFIRDLGIGFFAYHWRTIIINQ
jgi:hypothetical protein